MKVTACTSSASQIALSLAIRGRSVCDVGARSAPIACTALAMLPPLRCTVAAASAYSALLLGMSAVTVIAVTECEHGAVRAVAECEQRYHESCYRVRARNGGCCYRVQAARHHESCYRVRACYIDNKRVSAPIAHTLVATGNLMDVVMHMPSCIVCTFSITERIFSTTLCTSMK